ncbi:hypothetical protein [Candidatus Avelusimicrobium fimicolum]|uniref:hypothetical protein n=1 Tax=Candidatus Avelusimicrobium fimicolum TaxID=3416216 RepID=UPI003D121D38
MKRYLKTPEEVIQALKEGKTIKSEHGYAYELKDNFIIQTLLGKIRSINTTIFFDEYYYINEPEPLKLEVGKFYKTRNGRKAWIVEGTEDDTFPFRVAAQKESAVYTVTKEGKRFSEGMSGSDLVAPWED